MTRDELRERLLRCVNDAVMLAEHKIGEQLPYVYRFELAAFRRTGRETPLDYLYRDGMFPVVVDVAMWGQTWP